MTATSDTAQREVETFLRFVARDLTDYAIEARAYQHTHPYTNEDFETLAHRLDTADTTASFDFLARDLPETATAIDHLASAGHEIVLHGYRHTHFSDVSYETAYDELSQALDAFDETTRVRPTGFHVPFMDTSPGTLEAAAELGIEWILGRETTMTDTEIPMHLPIRPLDIHHFLNGVSPADTFETLTESMNTHAVFLCHPNIHGYFAADDAFDDWLDANDLGAITEFTDTTGVGLIIDCALPISVL